MYLATSPAQRLNVCLNPFSRPYLSKPELLTVELYFPFFAHCPPVTLYPSDALSGAEFGWGLFILDTSRVAPLYKRAVRLCFVP